MTTVKEKIQAFESSLSAASEAAAPFDALNAAITKFFPLKLFKEQKDDWSFVRAKGNGSFWLAIKVVGPGRFKISDNRNVSGPSIVDFGAGFDCSVQQLAAEITKLAAR